MKSTISFLSLSFIIQLKANRLLQKVNPEYCESDKDCVVKNVGNCCGYYPQCVNIDYIPDPEAVKKECEKKGLVSICGWAEISRCSCRDNQCDEVYDAIGIVAGASCGVQGTDCKALGAPASICSDGKTCFGNCGGCVYADDGSGNLVCSPEIVSKDVCPVAGDICGTQGNECPAIKAAAFTCPDGTTCYGNCGKCTYEDDGKGGLTCSSMIPKERVCPDQNEECGPLQCRNDRGDCQTATCILDPCNFVPSPCKADQKCIATTCNGCKAQCVPGVGCGIDNCIKYTDGCNECTCNADGSESCTKKACIETVVFVRKCLDCEFGYRLDENDKCVKKKECENSSDCDRPEFRCKPDPICRGKGRNNPNCTPRPRVCYAKGGRCTSDADCDGNNGFKCIGINNQGTGVCTKYQL